VQYLSLHLLSIYSFLQWVSSSISYMSITTRIWWILHQDWGDSMCSCYSLLQHRRGRRLCLCWFARWEIGNSWTWIDELWLWFLRLCSSRSSRHNLLVRLCSVVYVVAVVRLFASWLFVGKQSEQPVSAINNQPRFLKLHDESIVDFNPGGRIGSCSLFSVFKVLR